MTHSNPATLAVLSMLQESGYEVRKSANGWSSRCPAHHDRNPSLSVAVGSSGRCLLKCHAGCKTTAIVEALGLTMKDLMPSPNPIRSRSSQEPVTKPGRASRQAFSSPQAAIDALVPSRGFPSRRWEYTNMAGDLVGLVLRWDRSNHQKAILPLSQHDGMWRIEAMPEPRPLLMMTRLATLPERSMVFVVEGEKCVDAAQHIGLIATTSAGGYQAARQSDWSALKGHIVVILPDNDTAGESYAEDVSRLCTAAGALEIRIVRLAEHWPDLAPKGDIADLLEMQSGDPKALRDKIIALATEASCIQSEESSTESPPDHPVFDPSTLFPASAAEVCDFFAELGRSMQVPPEMVALLGLAVASGCICNVACVQGAGDHIEPAPLWAMVLSEPGTRKSAVMGALLKPILDWEASRRAETQPVIAAAIQRRRLADRRLRALEEQASKCSDPAKRACIEKEAVKLAQETDAEPIPVEPALLTSEPTSEAMVIQMKGNHGRALLASAEGDALDIVQGRYSGTRNYGAMLKGHAGDPIRSHRVGRPTDAIDRPALAVALCIQRAAVEAVWDDPQAEGRGFIARFAVIAPPDLVGNREVRPLPVTPSARETWRAVITRLLSFTPSNDPTVISLSPEADALYYDFQLRTESALGWGDLAERRAWGGKLCGLALRIALTLHALATWGRTGTPSDPQHIDAETMTAAIAWADYLAASERHARLSITEPEEQRTVRRQLALIARHQGCVSIRQWQRLRSLPRAANAEAELKALATAGHGCMSWSAPGPRGGRRSRCFVLRTSGPASNSGPPPGSPAAMTRTSPQILSVLSVSDSTVAQSDA